MLLMPNCCRLVAGEAIDDVFDRLSGRVSI